MKQDELHIRIDSQTKEMLRILAEADGRTMAGAVIKMIKDAYEKLNK